jgi:hypothetical protein
MKTKKLLFYLLAGLLGGCIWLLAIWSAFGLSSDAPPR